MFQIYWWECQTRIDDKKNCQTRLMTASMTKSSPWGLIFLLLCCVVMPFVLQWLLKIQVAFKCFYCLDFSSNFGCSLFSIFFPSYDADRWFWILQRKTALLSWMNSWSMWLGLVHNLSFNGGMEMKPKNPVFWGAIESSKLSETFIWMHCELETFRKNCDRFYLNVFPIVCSTFVYWNHNRFYHKCISNPVILFLFNISWQVSFQMYFQSCDLFIHYRLKILNKKFDNFFENMWYK